MGEKYNIINVVCMVTGAQTLRLKQQAADDRLRMGRRAAVRCR